MDKEKRSILSLRDITKTYVVENEVVEVVKNISFDVYDNEFLVILGPGHCGKSVLLNLIAGLEKPLMGEIFLDGEKIVGSDSRIAMVFQRLALLPWKTVMGNVEIGPLLAGTDKKDRREKAQKYIDLVRLTGFEDYYVLSLIHIYNPTFTVDLLIKDTQLALQMAKDAGAPSVMAGTAQLYNEIAAANGYGKEDSSALYKTYKRHFRCV